MRLAAAVSAAAAAALLVALPQPGAAFLMPSSAAASLRRPREAASVSSSSSRLGATSLHNPEGAFTGSSSSSSSGRGKGELMGAADDDLQQALFKEDSRRVILFDGDCGFCSEGGRFTGWRRVGLCAPVWAGHSGSTMPSGCD